MTRMLLSVLVIVAVSTVGCGAPNSPDQSQLEAQARSFMKEYADDLRAKNREGIAERYDARGAYFLRPGSMWLVPLDSIRAQYVNEWSGPQYFQWQDLAYEVVGDTAVLVTGEFLWKEEGVADTAQGSYTGLLLRRDGGFQVRLEHEGLNPAYVAEHR